MIMRGSAVRTVMSSMPEVAPFEANAAMPCRSASKYVPPMVVARADSKNSTQLLHSELLRWHVHSVQNDASQQRWGLQMRCATSTCVRRTWMLQHDGRDEVGTLSTTASSVSRPQMC